MAGNQDRPHQDHYEVEFTPGADDLGLSGREQEIIELQIKGYSEREIASELGIAENTVSRHLANISGKVNSDKKFRKGGALIDLINNGIVKVK